MCAEQKQRPKEFTVKPTQGRLGAMSSQEIEVELVSNSIRRYEYGLTVSIQGVGQDVMTLPITAKYV